MAFFTWLMMSILLGLTVAAFAVSQGAGILACLLIYAAAGQMALLPLLTRNCDKLDR